MEGAARRTAKASALALCMAWPAAAHSEDIRIAYDLYAGGFRVGVVEASATLNGAAYDAKAEFRTEGTLADLFPVTFLFAAHGARDGGTLRPARYDSQFIGFEGDPEQDALYDETGAHPLAVVPDWTGMKGPEAALGQALSLDPVTRVIEAVLREGAPCPRRIDVFDGIRAYRLDFKLIGPDHVEPYEGSVFAGEAMLCSWRYELLAAQKGDWAESYFGEAPPEGEIWFARDGAGRFTIPVKLIAHTPVVDAVMHLMRAESAGAPLFPPPAEP